MHFLTLKIYCFFFSAWDLPNNIGDSILQVCSRHPELHSSPSSTLCSVPIAINHFIQLVRVGYTSFLHRSLSGRAQTDSWCSARFKGTKRKGWKRSSIKMAASFKSALVISKVDLWDRYHMNFNMHLGISRIRTNNFQRLIKLRMRVPKLFPIT